MNGYFPHPYPEELFYSILARYLSHQDLSVSDFRRCFSNINDIAFHTLLAGKLDKFIELSKHHLKVDNILQNHTIFPLISSFLSEKKKRKVISIIKGNKGTMLFKFPDIISSLNDTLHYCPLCYLEDTNQYGEPYWHRLHQVNTVIICPYHFCYLLPLKFHRLIKKTTLFPLETQNCETNKVLFCKDKKLLDFTHCLFKLLINESFKEKLKSECFALLYQKGFYQGSKISNKKLRDSFLEFYGEQLLESQLSLPKIILKNSWLAKTARSFGVCPSMNALLWCFLKDLPDENILGVIIDKREKVHAKAKIGSSAPFKCINRAASHYKEPVIYDYKINFIEESKKTTETFFCDCGMIFFRFSSWVKGKFTQKILVKEPGSVLELEIIKKVKAGHSLRFIANFFDVSESIVINCCKKVGIPEPKRTKTKAKITYIGDTWVKLIKEEDIQFHQTLWLKILEENPQESLKSLFKINSVSYRFLLAHSREFLSTSNKHFTKNKKKRSAEKDAQQAQKLREIIENFMINSMRENFNQWVSGKKIEQFLLQYERDLFKTTRKRTRYMVIRSCAEPYNDYKKRIQG